MGKNDKNEIIYNKMRKFVKILNFFKKCVDK